MTGESLKAVIMAAALAIAGWTTNPGPYQWSESHMAVDPTAISVASVYYLTDDGLPIVRPGPPSLAAACACQD